MKTAKRNTNYGTETGRAKKEFEEEGDKHKNEKEILEVCQKQETCENWRDCWTTRGRGQIQRIRTLQRSLMINLYLSPLRKLQRYLPLIYFFLGDKDETVPDTEVSKEEVLGHIKEQQVTRAEWYHPTVRKELKN